MGERHTVDGGPTFVAMLTRRCFRLLWRRASRVLKSDPHAALGLVVCGSSCLWLRGASSSVGPLHGRLQWTRDWSSAAGMELSFHGVKFFFLHDNDGLGPPDSPMRPDPLSKDPGHFLDPFGLAGNLVLDGDVPTRVVENCEFDGIHESSQCKVEFYVGSFWEALRVVREPADGAGTDVYRSVFVVRGMERAHDNARSMKQWGCG